MKLQETLLIVLCFSLFPASGWGGGGIKESREKATGIHFAPSRNRLYGGGWKNRWRESDQCQVEAGCKIKFNGAMRSVFLRYKWHVLNPAPGVYNFKEVNEAIDRVKVAGKSVSIVIMAGKYTPDWLLAKVPTLGLIHKRPEGSSGQIPVPWNSKFVDAYIKVLTALKRNLKVNKLLSTVDMVKNGLITINSAELRMMSPKSFQKGDVTDKQKGKLRIKVCRHWAKKGYREKKIIRTLRKSNKALVELFPSKVIGIGFVNGGNRFPTINTQGQCVISNGKMKPNKTLKKIITNFVNKYGRQTAINSSVLNNTLGGDYGIPPWFPEMRQKGAMIGFQINKQELGCVSDSNGDGKISLADKGCSKKNFKGALQRAFSVKAHFIEVHPNNIYRFKEILKDWNAEI